MREHFRLNRNKNMQADIKLMTEKHGNRWRRSKIMPQHRVLYAELQKPEHRGQMNKAMAAVGYPPSIQRVPTAVTKTKSWRALLDEHMSEDFLAKRHQELLNKREGDYIHVGRGKNRRVEFLDKGPDTTAVSRGLEMAYKLRGAFVHEPPPTPQPTNVYNLFYQPQVRASVTAFEDQLKHAIAHEIARNPQADTSGEGEVLAIGTEDNAGDAPQAGE